MVIHHYFVRTVSVLLFATFLIPGVSRGENPEAVPRVSNGEICEECGFAPAVVSFHTKVKGCTGTLVHPQIVITAAHCSNDYEFVEFTHMFDVGRKVNIDYCRDHPEYAERSNWDFAYCLLEEPVTDIPIIPVAFGCEFEMLIKKNQLATVCGFGHYNVQGHKDGRKRFGVSKIADILGNLGYGTLYVGPHNSVVGCPGDSGGPLLVQVPDGSWRSIAVLSMVSGECGGNSWNTYRTIRAAAEWIEEDSGIDITPCFAANGDWYPTEDCKGFWASPDNTPYGTWDKGCPGTPVSDYSATCGDPYPDFEPDTDTGSDSETDSETDTDTDTEEPEDDDDGCGCVATGSSPTRSLIELLFRR